MFDACRKVLCASNYNSVKTAKAFMTLGLIAALITACSTSSESDLILVVDKDRGEVRLTGYVQKTQMPRMTDWGANNQALLGSRGGEYQDHFVFLMDAQVPDIYKALLRIGADPGKATEGEMRGIPVEIFIQWTVGKYTHILPYQGFFQQKMPGGSEHLIVPWEPNFVFHGLGAKKEVDTGCIACPVYCPGGIIGDQSMSEPMLRAEWRILPRPGTKIMAIIRMTRSQVP